MTSRSKGGGGHTLCDVIHELTLNIYRNEVNISNWSTATDKKDRLLLIGFKRKNLMITHATRRICEFKVKNKDMSV